MALVLGVEVGSRINIGSHTVEVIRISDGQIMLRKPDRSIATIDGGPLTEILPSVRMGVTRSHGSQAHIAIAAPDDMSVLRHRPNNGT